MFRNGLITLAVALVMVVTASQIVMCQDAGRPCPGPKCTGVCGVAGGCCPKHPTYGYTETRWSRWPDRASMGSRTAPEGIPKSDPPIKGEELRDREVREDQKNTSASPSTGSLDVPPAEPIERRTPPESGMGRLGDPATDDFTPAAELMPPDASDGAVPTTPSTVPTEPTPAPDSTNPADPVDPFNGLGTFPWPLPSRDLLADATLLVAGVDSQNSRPAVEPQTTSRSRAEPKATTATPPTKESARTANRRPQAVQLASASDPIAPRDNPLRLRISRDRYASETAAEQEPEIVESFVPKAAEAAKGPVAPHRKTNPLRRS